MIGALRRMSDGDYGALYKLDFIEDSAASPGRLDVKDRFLSEYLMSSLESKPEPSEVADGAPAAPHVGPVEQLEAI